MLNATRFRAVAFSWLLCMGWSLGDEIATESRTPWYESSLLGYEVGPTGAQFGHSDPTDMAYCRNFDGAEIVRRCAEAKGDYVVVWARDGDYAYYDSKLLPKAPGLGERDPLKEAVAESQRVGIPLIAYCVVQQGGHFLTAHPEWVMREWDGRPLGRFCFNSGYGEALKQILAEQAAYGVDGFHIDMLDQGFGPPYGCWCESCQSKFQERYGRPMPSSATWDDAWNDLLEFRYVSSENLERGLTEYLHAVAPQVSVDFNYHGNPPFSFEVGQRPAQHALHGDFVTGETGVWGFSALGVGLNAEFYRAAAAGRPFQVVMQRGVRMYHDQTTRPLADMRWELRTLLARGAFVTMVDKTAFDGSLDPMAYERFKVLFTEASRLKDEFGHEPVYDVGIYFSSRTRDWVGREAPGDYFQAFQGAHRTCALEHLQFGVVLDESVSLEALQRFPVVCLPNVGILSDHEIEVFRQYCREGGCLVVTGASGCFDRYGNQQPETSLSDLIGARLVRRLDSRDNWVRFSDNSSDDAADAAGLWKGIPVDWPLLVHGPAVVYEPSTATALGELLEPERTARQRQEKMGDDWPMSSGAAVGPAALINRIGDGVVVTLAASPDSAVGGEYAIVEARKLLANAIRMALPSRRVEVLAPANVSAVVTDDAARRLLRIHLIAYQPTPRSTPPLNRPYVLPGLIEDDPLFRCEIALGFEPEEISAASPNTEVALTGRKITALVEGVHEVVRIRY